MHVKVEGLFSLEIEEDMRYAIVSNGRSSILAVFRSDFRDEALRMQERYPTTYVLDLETGKAVK